jgi:hypothetical protein
MQAIKLNLAMEKIPGRHIIVHGVNTLGLMGGGIALALNRGNPGLLKSYQDYIRDRLSGQDCFASIDKPPVSRHEELLGEVDYFSTDGKKIIANLFSQSRLRQHRSEVVADQDAILKGVADIIHTVQVNNSYAFTLDDPNYNSKVASIPATQIYFPRIGCDLGGLDWNELGPKIFALFAGKSHVRPVLVEWP